MRRHLVSFTSRAPRQSSQFGQMCYRGSGQTEGEGTEGGRDVVPSKHHPACGCSLAYLSLSNRWPCVRQSFMRPPDCSGEMNGSSREISVAKKRQGGARSSKQEVLTGAGCPSSSAVDGRSFVLLNLQGRPRSGLTVTPLATRHRPWLSNQ